MKRLFAVLLSMSLVFLVACTNEKPILVVDGDNYGQQFHFEFYGKEDDVKKLEKTTIINVVDADEEEIENTLEEYKTEIKKYKDLPIDISLNRDGKVITENATIKFDNKESNKKLMEAEFFMYLGDINEKIEIEPFAQMFEEVGFSVERNY